MYLFVYGTFCKGLSRNSILQNTEYLGIASCKGKAVKYWSLSCLDSG